MPMWFILAMFEFSLRQPGKASIVFLGRQDGYARYLALGKPKH